MSESIVLSTKPRRIREGARNLLMIQLANDSAKMMTPTPIAPDMK
jgi:hypothetical protein